MGDVIDERSAGEGFAKLFDAGFNIRTVITDDLFGNTGFLNGALQLFVNDIPVRLADLEIMLTARHLHRRDLFRIQGDGFVEFLESAGISLCPIERYDQQSRSSHRLSPFAGSACNNRAGESKIDLSTRTEPCPLF